MEPHDKREIYASIDFQLDCSVMESGTIQTEVWKGFSVIYVDTSVTKTTEMLLGVPTKQRKYLKLDESNISRTDNNAIVLKVDSNDRICLQEHTFEIDDQNNPGLVYSGSAYINIGVFAKPGTQKVFNLRVVDSRVRGTAVSFIFNGFVTKTDGKDTVVDYKLIMNENKDDSSAKMESRIEESLNFMMDNLQEGHTKKNLTKIYTPIGPTEGSVRYAPISSIVTPLDATWAQVDEMCRVFMTFVFHGHESDLNEMITSAARPCYRYCRMYEQIAATVLQFLVRFTQYKTDVIIAEGPDTFKKILFDIFPFGKHEYDPSVILLRAGDCDDGACLFLAIAKTIGINPFPAPSGEDKFGNEFSSTKYPHMDAIRKALTLRVATGAIVSASVSSASSMDNDEMSGTAGHMCCFLIEIRAMTDALVNGLIMRDKIEQHNMHTKDATEFNCRPLDTVGDDGLRVSVLSGLLSPSKAIELCHVAAINSSEVDYEIVANFLFDLVQRPDEVLYIEGTATPSNLHLCLQQPPGNEEWCLQKQVAQHLREISRGTLDVAVHTIDGNTGKSNFVVAIAEFVGLEIIPTVPHPKMPYSIKEAHIVGPVVQDGESFTIGVRKGVLSEDFQQYRFAAIPAIVGKQSEKQYGTIDTENTKNTNDSKSANNADDAKVDQMYKHELERFRPKGTTEETLDISTLIPVSSWHVLESNVDYIMKELHEKSHKNYNPELANGYSVNFSVHFRQLLFFPDMGKRVVAYVKEVLDYHDKPYTCRVYKGVFYGLFKSKAAHDKVVQLFVVIQFAK